MSHSIDEVFGSSEASVADAVSASITAEMVQHFISRTRKHIALVQKAADLAAAASPEEYGDLPTQVINHDASKFQEPEYLPYVLLTWQYKCYGEKTKFQVTKEQQAAMHAATLHHIRHNDHHPEAWATEEAQLDANDRDKSKSAIDVSCMPKLAIQHAVCDWWAMSEEKGTNTVRQWYDSVRGTRWVFSRSQEQWIEALIKVFEVDKMDEAKVIVKQAQRTEEQWICPHCKQEIQEKSTFHDQEKDTWHHHCEFNHLPIELPPTDMSKYNTEWLTALDNMAKSRGLPESVEEAFGQSGVFYRVWTRDGDYWEEFSSLKKAEKYYDDLVKMGKKVILDQWTGRKTDGEWDGDYQKTLKTNESDELFGMSLGVLEGMNYHVMGLDFDLVEVNSAVRLKRDKENADYYHSDAGGRKWVIRRAYDNNDNRVGWDIFDVTDGKDVGDDTWVDRYHQLQAVKCMIYHWTRKKTESVEDIQDLVNIQKGCLTGGTKSQNAYMRGLYNGLVVALATAEDRNLEDGELLGEDDVVETIQQKMSALLQEAYTNTALSKIVCDAISNYLRPLAKEHFAKVDREMMERDVKQTGKTVQSYEYIFKNVVTRIRGNTITAYVFWSWKLKLKGNKYPDEGDSYSYGDVDLSREIDWSQFSYPVWGDEKRAFEGVDHEHVEALEEDWKSKLTAAALAGTLFASPVQASTAITPKTQQIAPVEDNIVAKVIAGEAAGEGYAGMHAVACVIQNRMKNGQSARDVVTRRAQFSAYNDKALMSRNYAQVKATADELARQIGQLEDTTGGATHYVAKWLYDKATSDAAWAKANNVSWIRNMAKTKEIGRHVFMRELSVREQRLSIHTRGELGFSEYVDRVTLAVGGDAVVEAVSGYEVTIHGVTDHLPAQYRFTHALDERQALRNVVMKVAQDFGSRGWKFTDRGFSATIAPQYAPLIIKHLSQNTKLWTARKLEEPA